MEVTVCLCCRPAFGLMTTREGHHDCHTVLPYAARSLQRAKPLRAAFTCEGCQMRHIHLMRMCVLPAEYYYDTGGNTSILDQTFLSARLFWRAL